MTEPTKCPYCGAEILEGASFCIHCMRALTKKKDIPVMLPHRQSRIWVPLLCLSCILLFALIFVLCYKEEPTGISVPNDIYRSGDVTNNSGSIPTPDPGTAYPISQLIDAEVSDLTDSTPEDTPTEDDASSGELTSEIIAENDSTVDPTPEQGATSPTEQVNTPGGETEITEETEDNPDLPTNPTEPEIIPPVSVGCTHSYSKATCVSPQTCALCGETSGDAVPDGHNWVGHTRTIHHEEIGHWEEVVTHSVREIQYLCFYCGYNREGYVSFDALRAHMTVHSHKSDYQYILSKIESISDTREVWVPVYETQWIVDQKAYTETITEYTCSYCGKDK